MQKICKPNLLELTKFPVQIIMENVFFEKQEMEGVQFVVRIFKTIEGAIHQIQEPQEDCWIAMTNPTATEIFEMSERFGIEVDDLRAPLDEEERSRIEVEDNYTLILVDVPMIEERNDKDWYGTIPLGIIVTKKMIFTVCLEDTQVLTRFMEGRVRNFFTYMKTRFILQILYRNATMYLHYLRIIDKKSEQVEEKLHMSTRNQELMELFQVIRVGGQRDAGHQRQLGTAGGRGDKMVWLPRMEIDLDLSGLPYHAVALGAKKVRRYSLFQLPAKETACPLDALLMHEGHRRRSHLDAGANRFDRQVGFPIHAEERQVVLHTEHLDGGIRVVPQEHRKVLHSPETVACDDMTEKCVD